jgi:hypothetical protein
MSVEAKKTRALTKMLEALRKASIEAHAFEARAPFKGSPAVQARIVVRCSRRNTRDAIVTADDDGVLSCAPATRRTTADDMKRIERIVRAVNATVKPIDAALGADDARAKLVRHHFPDATIEKFPGDDFDVYFASGIRWSDVDFIADNEGNISIVRYAILKKGSTVARVYERQPSPLGAYQALVAFKAKHRASYAKLVAVACKEAA